VQQTSFCIQPAYGVALLDLPFQCLEAGLLGGDGLYQFFHPGVIGHPFIRNIFESNRFAGNPDKFLAVCQNFDAVIDTVFEAVIRLSAVNRLKAATPICFAFFQKLCQTLCLEYHGFGTPACRGRSFFSFDRIDPKFSV